MEELAIVPPSTHFIVKQLIAQIEDKFTDFAQAQTFLEKEKLRQESLTVPDPSIPAALEKIQDRNIKHAKKMVIEADT